MSFTRIFQFFCGLCFLAALTGFALLALAPPGTDLGVFAGSPDDKFGHAAAFFVLTPLAAAGLPQVRLRWIILTLTIIGCGLEGGQVLSGREFSLEDVAANQTGIAAALFPMLVMRLRAAARPFRKGSPDDLS